MKTCTLRQSRAAVLALVFFVITSFALAQETAGKRPITHRDYAGWHNIQNQKLSPDGKFVAYATFPEEGDGQLVVRNLTTGKEYREPVGAKPPTPPYDPLAEVTGERRQNADRGISVAFTADSTKLVFSTFPSKAESDKTKRAKKKPAEMPKGGMGIMDLATGAVTRIDSVKNFQVPEKSSTWLAYLKEPKPEPKKVGTGCPAKPETAAEEGKKQDQEAGDDQSESRDKKKDYGSELVLRDLNNGTERSFDDVTEYTITKNGELLVYAVSSKNAAGNGVYALKTRSADAAQTLAAGKGKYAKLTWDDKQVQLAFVTDRDDQKSKPSKFSLYRWEPNAAAAQSIVAPGDKGLKKDYVVSDKGSLNFTTDGQHLFFGVAEYQPDQGKDNLLDEDKVSADLWSWKDDNVQPMQKARARADRNRTYRAVYHLNSGKAVQLGDPTVAQVVPSEDGLWAIGTDNREYRPAIEYGIRTSDSYLLNTVTGERKLIARNHPNRMQWSPDSKHILNFDTKDWISYAVPALTKVNLTEKLNVKFADEEDDHPDVPDAYGVGDWTRDGKYVLLYDRYDIWQAALDAGNPTNLTAGTGRTTKTQFRYVHVNSDSKDPAERWIDASEPILLHAENEDTRDSGFYRTRIGANAAPEKLILAAKAFTNPVRARNADVLILTESTFDEFPDLRIADPDFRTIKRISDANPQKAKLLWGTGELISYRNGDGVLLKAALYKPENFDPKKKYPMMVYIYEKLSQNVHRFVNPGPGTSINPSYYVSNGYLVLMPDIVYTVGYPGQSALKCVLAAVDAVVDQGFVDEKAIGIQGHSWGGYQIAYMITQTTRFRAVAAGAPVSNMTSAYDGIRWGSGLPRQFQYERTQSRIGGTLWQYPMRFIENSPVFMADRVQTPILMLHNDTDDMVPWYQGIEYFLALRRLGKEAYLFSYNGEPHGLRRRADQKDYTVRMQQFFDHFLKGAPEPDWMKNGIPYLTRQEEKVRFNADAYGTEEQNVSVPAGKASDGASPR